MSAHALLSSASLNASNPINIMLRKLNKVFYFFAYSAVICALVAGGLYFAMLKNQHTIVQRDIDKIERRTRNHQNLLSQYKADLQNSSNRFLLKDKIKSQHTGLIPIAQQDVITIPAMSNPRLVQAE